MINFKNSWISWIAESLYFPWFHRLFFSRSVFMVCSKMCDYSLLWMHYDLTFVHQADVHYHPTLIQMRDRVQWRNTLRSRFWFCSARWGEGRIILGKALMWIRLDWQVSHWFDGCFMLFIISFLAYWMKSRQGVTCHQPTNMPH